MHGSLVTSSLIRETTENESANEGYRFGQEEETYNIVVELSLNGDAASSDDTLRRKILRGLTSDDSNPPEIIFLALLLDEATRKQEVSFQILCS
jgi:hypothetical protein